MKKRAALLLLLLALGLAWRFLPHTDEKKADITSRSPNETNPAPAIIGQPAFPSSENNTSPRVLPPREAATSPVDAQPQTKLSKRKKGLTIPDFEKHGIFVEAEHVGKNSASGKVRITYRPGEAGAEVVLEADRAKMSSNGMLVAEGNAVAVKGESRFSFGGENGAVAIYVDEDTQNVVIRANSADKVLKQTDPNDPSITDPDRGPRYGLEDGPSLKAK